MPNSKNQKKISSDNYFFKESDRKEKHDAFLHQLRNTVLGKLSTLLRDNGVHTCEVVDEFFDETLKQLINQDVFFCTLPDARITTLKKEIKQEVRGKWVITRCIQLKKMSLCTPILSTYPD